MRLSPVQRRFVPHVIAERMAKRKQMPPTQRYERSELKH
jgi:hypothetical protein